MNKEFESTRYGLQEDRTWADSGETETYSKDTQVEYFPCTDTVSKKTETSAWGDPVQSDADIWAYDEDGRLVTRTHESDGYTYVTHAEHKGSTPTECIVDPMDPDGSES